MNKTKYQESYMQLYLAILRLKCELLEKPYEYNSIETERKLRILSKNKRIDKIEILKEECG